MLAATCRGGRGRQYALRNHRGIEPKAIFPRLRTYEPLWLFICPVPRACSGQTLEYALTSRNDFSFSVDDQASRHFRRTADLCPEQVEVVSLEVTPRGIKHA